MKKGFSLAEALIAVAIIGIVAAITIPVINNVRPDKDKTFYNKALSSVQGAMAKSMELPILQKRYNYWEDGSYLKQTYLDDGGYSTGNFNTTKTNGNGNTSYAIITNLYWADDTNTSIGYDTFCKKMADFLNTSGAINCSSEPPSSYDSPNFITTDGVRYWGLEGKFDIGDAMEGNGRIIYVDRKLSDSERARLNNENKYLRDSSHTEPGLKITLYYDGRAETGTTEDFDYENELIKTSINLKKESGTEEDAQNN
ncbi:MAG: prepilin-type N-terminal cleavage/methylation domain-containing protein [Candidatus Gastranaerophilales bacterium]|nr:prepilin-type N-terminal cleavage/methylation domain-containing protein [Candidatus Gastranaerophilales bacterium]